MNESNAGAMNAVLLADGWRRGGREGARQPMAAAGVGAGRRAMVGVEARSG